jgi:hypothetical protein
VRTAVSQFDARSDATVLNQVKGLVSYQLDV